MAILYADKDGRIIRVLQTLAEEIQYPDPPPGTVATLEIDFAAAENPLILEMLHEDWKGARLTGGKFVWDDLELTPDLTPAPMDDESRLLAIYQGLVRGETPPTEDLNWLLVRLTRLLL